jgi:hypothetical protein
MALIFLPFLAFVGGAVAGWVAALIAYIVYFEMTDAIDREGGTAMAVAFALGPLLGVIVGTVAAIITARAVSARRKASKP